MTARLAEIGRAIRLVLGAPDYEGYVAHVRENHPEKEPLTRDEFVRERMENRYSKPGGRCC